MFFSLNVLRRGGTFYQCWVADTWPLRLESMSSRQIMAMNIPHLCDQLLEVINTESYSPKRRFSLRLSIRILHGIIHLYSRQCTLVMGELWSIYISIHQFQDEGGEPVDTPHSEDDEDTAQRRRRRRRIPRRRPVPAIQAQPGDVEVMTVEAQVHRDAELESEDTQRGRPGVQVITVVAQVHRAEEELIMAGALNHTVDENAITLREDPIPSHPIFVDDGFVKEGEAAPELVESLEMMLGPGHVADLTTDRSLLARPTVGRTYYTASPKHDVAYREATSINRTLDVTGLFGTDVIEERTLDAPILLPTSPATAAAASLLSPRTRQVPAAQQLPLYEDEPLAPLEDDVPRKRVRGRRARSGPIVDKCIRLTKQQLASQLEQVNSNQSDHVRICDPHYTENIMNISIHGWRRNSLFHSPALVRLFSRNLGRCRSRDARDELREALPEPARGVVGVVRAPQLSLLPPENEVVSPPPRELSHSVQQAQTSELEIIPDAGPRGLQKRSAVPPVPLSPAMVPTSELDIISVAGPSGLQKHSAVPPVPQSPATVPTSDLVFIPGAGPSGLQKHSAVPPAPLSPAPVPASELDVITVAGSSRLQKRSAVSPVPPTPAPTKKHCRRTLSEEVSIALQESFGSAASELNRAIVDVSLLDTSTTETQLGSLDRTAVDLGVPVSPTPSCANIKSEFGLEGTMRKVVEALSQGVTGLKAETLVRLTPASAVPYSRVIAVALCFSSIMRLKKEGLLRVYKDPQTLNIVDIKMGPRFDNIMDHSS